MVSEKNSRTSDSLFIVKSVISKYVNTDNKKLFGCFIDLKKAFDSVWRLGLLYKIIKNDNIGLKLYNIIKDMYKQTEASVKVGENLSNYVSIDRGVKQGDSLSPNLFNIYINDLPDIFDKSCQPVTIDKLTISCLMFADDILLLSESAEGLQNALNKVAEYCRKWQLSVNTKKTKIIVFQKKNIPYTKSDFFLNGCKLEKVLKYKYLGNLIEASGKFHSTHVELSKKGSKVLFSMFKSLNPSDNIPLNIHKKLFDSLVKPILMYNSEIWYMDFYEKIIKKQLRANKSNTNFDILALLDSSFVEKVNLKFCKFVLGISKKSVNIAARAEISQYPVDVYIKLQVLKYLARISNNNNNPLLVDAYHLSKCLHSKGSYSWYSFAENICSYNKIDMKDIENIDYKKEKCSFSKTIKNQLQENYEQLFFQKMKSLTDNNKLFLYSKVKTKYTTDPFLSDTNFENRRLLVKMRISDHNLEIETGRYNKISREHRICKNCNQNRIEDEEHFFFHCSKNEELRKELLDNIKQIHPNVKDIDNNILLTKILSSSTVMQLAAPFIKKSLALRRVDSKDA